jgi:HD-GYP domain-containing protein (c-di-GMP phosphodiesterase class II)
MILRTKIISIMAMVLLISVGISTTITLHAQNKKIIAAKVADTETLINIILRSIESAMADGRTHEVQRALENIGKNAEVLNLRIVSNDGFILKSKNPEEIGLKSKEYSQLKYKDNRYKPVVEGNVINMIVPVENKKQCFGCHSGNISVNGLIEMTYDISRTNAGMLAVKRFLVLSNILTVLIVATLLGFMFTRFVTTPLNRFMGTIKAVEDGDLDARVKVTSGDELGSIQTAFNKMLEEIKNLYDKNIKKEKEISKVKVELDHKRALEELNTQLQYKIKEVETANKAVLSLSKELKSKNIELQTMVERLEKINEVGRMLTSIIETDELIKIIIRTTAELLQTEKGSIHLARSEEEKLTLVYKRGIGVEATTAQVHEIHSLYSELLSEGASVLIGKDDAQNRLPAIGVPLKMKGQIIGGMHLETKGGGAEFSEDELELLVTLANQAMVAIENAWLYETVKNNYFGTIQALVNALEASDQYTKGHSERVRYLSLELARYVGLDFKELEVLEHAAILHDIGKIGIDSMVLNKKGQLSSSEFSLVRAHPIIGDEILGPIGTLEGVRTTILQHHERYDGGGYPYGIAGDEISLKARILAVVDTFDAMLMDRPYRKAFPLNLALDELRQGAGTQFDPFVVNAFLELLYTKEDLLKEAGYSFA